MKRQILGIIIIIGWGMMACGNTHREQEKESPVVMQEKKKRSFQLPEVPVMLNTPELRAVYVAQHYWDHFDFRAPPPRRQTSPLWRPCFVSV